MDKQIKFIKEMQNFMSQHKFSNWSCYRAGAIAEHIFSDSEPQHEVSIAIFNGEDVNEIVLILSHIFSCNIRIEPKGHGLRLIINVKPPNC